VPLLSAWPHSALADGRDRLPPDKTTDIKFSDEVVVVLVPTIIGFKNRWQNPLVGTIPLVLFAHFRVNFYLLPLQNETHHEELTQNNGSM
jgi:hypothetical protein